MAMNKSLGEMLRFVSTEESQALQAICEYNDISEEQLMSPENITTLEMFLFNFTRICCMTFFPNLTSLSLVQQNLRTMEGLHCLPHLEILRLSENEIQRIEGLSNCLKLKEIYLHNNRISRISNLSHLSALRVLWLANNIIRWVEGLDNLQIKELNLAKNPLYRLGDILKLKSLKYLNVSGTSIGSFKEIGNLTRLKKLRDLRFSDPNWGPSPLSLLHNYQTYILFRLQDLQKLDTVDITDEAKHTAKTTYTRKRVYYNLCIKSLQQSRNNINKYETDSKRIKGLQMILAHYVRASRDIEKSLSGVVDIGNSSKQPSAALSTQQNRLTESKAKVATLTEQIHMLLERLDYIAKDLRLCKASEHAAIDLSIHWLMVELDSGGNIRMEAGNPTDVWYKSCMELVMSRFFLDDYAPLGITGVHVNKVTRIHNRFLQDRFEKHHEHQLLKSANKNVEYLLCGETLKVPDELQCIVEDGFLLSPDQVMNGCSSPVILSNSVGLADRCRLKVLVDHLHGDFPRCRTTGWLLVVKTCLGTSVKDVRCKYTQVPYAKEYSGSSKVDGDGSIAKKSYPHADSVYRSHPTDAKQRSWFVFDAAVVVPEYLVEFEYCFTAGVHECQASRSYGSSGGLVDLLGNNLEDLLSHDYLDPPLVLSCGPSSMPQVHLDKSGNVEASVPCGPSSKLSNAFVSLSIDFIRQSVGVTDLQLITNLNLHNSNISNIESLRGLPSLKVLILCFNKISKISGLEELILLEKLDLSYNFVTRIESLNGLSNLATLDLGGNLIWNPSDLTALQCQIPGLLSLNLRANPIVDDMDYPMMVLRNLSSLVELDSKPVPLEDHIGADRKHMSSPTLLFSGPMSEWGYLLSTSSILSSSIHEKDLQDGSHFEGGNAKSRGNSEVGARDESFEGEASNANVSFLKRLDNPFRLSPYNMTRCRLCPVRTFLRYEMANKKSRMHLQHKSDEAWYDDVEEVHLQHCKLKTMHCFDRLSNLRRLYLCGNGISTIEGLDKCNLLEELVLSDNNIEKLDSIQHMHCLWRLDLSHNNLVSCGEIGSFQALEQLSIDYNRIQSLKGLDALASLMELYAAHNILADLQEMNHIRSLPKLIVVDLSENALSRIDDYRSHTIFTLRKLKVLDGRNVESYEVTLARNKYLGRLTQDMLKERVGRCLFSNLEVLNLSGQRLRSCGEVFESEELHGLIKLNLSDNLLSSVYPLRFLANLKVLELENNKFEDRPLFEAPTSHLGLTECLESSSSVIDMDQGGSVSTSTATASIPDDGLSLSLLEILKLGGNTITNISSLCLVNYKFPKLKVLALQDNKIAKVDGLGGLNALEELYLDHNEIKELEPLAFAQLQSLRVLSITDNALKTLVHINGLVALQYLDLASNQIAPNRTGGLASIESLSGLLQLSKLSFINNPICRQNLYRVSVLSRLLHLQYLDERPVTQEERQEAEAYANGNKEPTPLVMDPNALLDYHTSSQQISNGCQVKVPLKMASLNFESLCLQQTPRGSNQFATPSKSRVVAYNHVANSLGVKSWATDDLRQPGVLGRCLDRNQPLVQGKVKGENKVLMLPYSAYVKSSDSSKDWNQKTDIQSRGFAL